MTQDKIYIPVRLAETKYTCGDCSNFNTKTNTCAKKTSCGGIITTLSYLKACVNFVPLTRKTCHNEELENLYRALMILSQDGTPCKECPLMEICPIDEDCIRETASEYVKAIQKTYSQLEGLDASCDNCRFKKTCSTHKNGFCATVYCSKHVLEEQK